MNQRLENSIVVLRISVIVFAWDVILLSSLVIFFYLAAAKTSPTHVARLEWRWAGRVGQDIRGNVGERNCMALPHHSLCLCRNNIFFIFAKPTLFRTFHLFFSSKEPDYNVAELWTLGLIAKNNDKFNIWVAIFLTDYWYRFESIESDSCQKKSIP